MEKEGWTFGFIWDEKKKGGLTLAYDIKAYCKYKEI